MAVVEYDLSELLKTPKKPLTKEQLEHFDEYMAFKNHDISASEVDISEAVEEIIANMDYYCGFTEEKVK